ncbi:unnamed protein product [Dicrocoelium dendriticum]|nr:unnamed protein product [Dicrocoelium dendriticum]
MPKQSSCGTCSKLVGYRANALTCVLCQVKYHISCVGLSVEHFHRLRKIQHDFIQTVCENCRNKIQPERVKPTCRPQRFVANSSVCLAQQPSAKSLQVSTQSSSSTRANSPTPSPTVVRSPVAPGLNCLPLLCPTDTDVPAGESLSAEDQWKEQRTKLRRNVGCLRSVSQQLAKPREAGSILCPARPTSSYQRRYNLVIFHAPESSDPSPQVRYDHDVEFLQGLIDRLLDAGEDSVKVRQITRLGKQGDQHNRPMRITFVDEATPRLIMSRLSRLKGLKIHVRPDLDPVDRERLKSAIIELKRRTGEGETNLRIVNFRVVSNNPRIRINRLLTLQARPAASAAACE